MNHPNEIFFRTELILINFKKIETIFFVRNKNCPLINSISQTILSPILKPKALLWAIICCPFRTYFFLSFVISIFIAHANPYRAIIDAYNFYIIIFLRTCSFTNPSTMRADDKQSGIPPPGCTLPPTKYNPLISLLKLAWRLNDAYRLLELLP